MTRLLAILLIGLLASTLFTSAHSTADNAALTEMYNVDQKAREGEHIDWARLYKDDLQRRVDLSRLLAAGEVRTGNDYYHAAMIFQHGENPDEYLLAHVLAMDAVAQGSKEARWLSAATLDRYLLSIWQPQVFGTQFSRDGSNPMKHDRINSEIVSDLSRAATCVVSVAEQQKILDQVNHGGELGSTALKETCR